MRVLVIGSGAREHALLLALGKDPQVSGLIVAPGNAGTARIAEQHDVDITSAEAVVALAREVGADMVVIGPEVPLVLGVADAVRAGAGDLLEDIALFDVFTGPQIGEHRKSLTFALRFRAPDRTLTEDDASAARDAAVQSAAERVGAVLRG